MTTPYVDPDSIHTPSVGTSPPASWGNAVRDGLEYLMAPPGCMTVRSSQSIPNNAFTTVDFTDADVRDTDGFHSTSTDSTKIIIPTGFAGWYMCGARYSFASNGTGNRQSRFLLNGSNAIDPNNGPWVHLGSTSSAGGIPEWPIYLNVGDELELSVFQNSGGSLSLSGATMWVTYMGKA